MFFKVLKNDKFVTIRENFQSCTLKLLPVYDTCIWVSTFTSKPNIVSHIFLLDIKYIEYFDRFDSE